MRLAFLRSILLAVALAPLAPGPAAQADTTRIYQPGGQGWVDETTNARGDVVRRQSHDASGRLTKDTTYDPDSHQPTGSTEHTYDGASTRPGTTTRRDGEGDKVEEHTFDDAGRVARHETFDEDGMPEARTEYNYDGDGNLTDLNVFDGSGELTTSHHFSWKDGQLDSASTMDHTGKNPGAEGQIFYNPDGSVAEQSGNPNGALRFVGRTADPNGHSSTDSHGNRITVRHNPDGTFDVSILHPDGRITEEHLRHGAGCYLGDGCPLGGRPGVANPGGNAGANPGASDTTDDEPIAQLPDRTGPPVKLHVPNVGRIPQHDVPHSGGRPPSRPRY